MDKVVGNIQYAMSSLNNSKFFAGLVMLMMNVGARYYTISLSKTQEDFIRYNLAREFIIFAMAWVATRDIITSIMITAAFVILADYLFNEQSKMCVIPESFIRHQQLMKSRIKSEKPVTPEKERKALETLERAKKQREMESQVKYLNLLQQQQFEQIL
jgi:hypothetical protein